MNTKRIVTPIIALMLAAQTGQVCAKDKKDELPEEIQQKIGLTKPFYEDVKPITNPSDILVLCNKYNKLDNTFVPKNLVDIGGGHKLNAEAAKGLSDMREAMKESGLKIVIRSTYRSYDRQSTIHRNYVKANGQAKTDTFSARPGHSEHQTGLAVDLVQAGDNSSSLSGARFEKTKQYEWMLENAHIYGYILRYPLEYEDVTGYKYEPWHWRYIGAEAATFMKENDIPTFDEYAAKYIITDVQ